MKLSEELLNEIREAIKKRDSIYHLMDEWVLSISVWTDRERILIDTLDDSLRNPAPMPERIGINFDLIDVDTDEVIAKIAYIELVLVPNDENKYKIICMADEYHDSFSTIVPLLDTKDWHDRGANRQVYEMYRGAGINLAELHTFYVSPSFREIGIASFLIENLNEILYTQFNKVIYLMAIIINPFKNQVDLDDEEPHGRDYMDEINEDNQEIYDNVFHAFARNGFVSYPGVEEKNWYYKNMFK